MIAVVGTGEPLVGADVIGMDVKESADAAF